MVATVAEEGALVGRCRRDAIIAIVRLVVWVVGIGWKSEWDGMEYGGRRMH